MSSTPHEFPENFPAEAADKLLKFRDRLAERSGDHLGYPYNFDHGKHLGPIHDLLRFSINNLGDPYDPSNYDVESRQFETDVIDTYARLWNIGTDKYWGYVAHSGTEGNRLCLEIAARWFPNGILYHSDETHYSVPGAATSFRLIAKCIKTSPGGEINYDELRTALAEGKAAGRPAIINLNIGTTMAGAFDRVDKTLAVLRELKYDIDNEVYIHLDGALSGLMVPFLKMIPEAERPDFTHPEVASYACSGHKFLGCPMPAGIVVIRGKFVEKVHERIEYLNADVVTSMGSRNGHSPVFLWFELQRKGIEGLQADTDQSVADAKYLFDLLSERKIACFRNYYSNTVVFERPRSLPFIKKYHLACKGPVAHVVVMPSVEKEKLLEFANAFAKLNEELDASGTAEPRPDIREKVGTNGHFYSPM